LISRNLSHNKPTPRSVWNFSIKRVRPGFSAFSVYNGVPRDFARNL
jgi:hypothetical protein